jgi:hypothetical protein
MNPIIDKNGIKRWFNDAGQLHREDGPAEIRDGNSIWCINGKLHRVDGPAIEWNDGTKEWYINGQTIACKDNEEFLRIIKINPIINEYETKRWFNDAGQLHREDGPAIEYSDGSTEYYINGKEHRLDGPAVEFVSGTKFWYINGEEIDCQDNEAFIRIVKMKFLL